MIRVLLDDAFLCLSDNGIARVWQQWIRAGVANRLFEKHGIEPLLVNRSDALADLDCERVDFPEFPLDLIGEDRRLLSSVAAHYGVDLTISSYFTFTYTAPSMLIVYDLIPEELDLQLADRIWTERKMAIAHASGYVAISAATRRRLNEFFPFRASSEAVVAYPGTDPLVFHPRSDAEVEAFLTRHQVTRPYLLMVGSRYQIGGYKNGDLLVSALEQGLLPEWDIVFVGGEAPTDRELGAAAKNCVRIAHLSLDDDDLACAYSGAEVLVYPSMKEGFGLPPLESLACGTPIITTLEASLPEVVGDLSLAISGRSAPELGHMCRLASSRALREKVRVEGPAWADGFQWGTFADDVLRQAKVVTSKARHDPDLPRRQAALRKHNDEVRRLQTRI